jgi:AraC family transcriptional regulator
MQAGNPSRILAMQGDAIRPLIPSGDPVGPPSPSPSLLIERFDLTPTGWLTHAHVDQVVALYLKRSRLHYSAGGQRAAVLELGDDKSTICRRGEAESIRWTQGASFLCVRICDEVLREAARSRRASGAVDLCVGAQVCDPRLAHLLYSLEAERQCGYPTGRLFIDRVEQALGMLLVSAHAGKGRALPGSTGGLSSRALRRVTDWMQANLHRPVTLLDLAGCAGLSVSHFAHQFRRSTGTSPHRYLLQLRIERGRMLLRSPDASVLDVALETGFQTQQHFATVFRRMTGLSPGEYRRTL